MTTTLSTGQPNVLGSWYDLCLMTFGDSPATDFIARKIVASPNGRDEPVVADERQLLHLLTTMHVQHIEEMKRLASLGEKS